MTSRNPGLVSEMSHKWSYANPRTNPFGPAAFTVDWLNSACSCGFKQLSKSPHNSRTFNKSSRVASVKIFWMAVVFGLRPHASVLAPVLLVLVVLEVRHLATTRSFAVAFGRFVVAAVALLRYLATLVHQNLFLASTCKAAPF